MNNLNIQDIVGELNMVALDCGQAVARIHAAVEGGIIYPIDDLQRSADHLAARSVAAKVMVKKLSKKTDWPVIERLKTFEGYVLMKVRRLVLELCAGRGDATTIKSDLLMLVEDWAEERTTEKPVYGPELGEEVAVERIVICPNCDQASIVDVGTGGQVVCTGCSGVYRYTAETADGTKGVLMARPVEWSDVGAPETTHIQKNNALYEELVTRVLGIEDILYGEKTLEFYRFVQATVQLAHKLRGDEVVLQPIEVGGPVDMERLSANLANTVGMLERAASRLLSKLDVATSIECPGLGCKRHHVIGLKDQCHVITCCDCGAVWRWDISEGGGITTTIGTKSL